VLFILLLASDDIIMNGVLELFSREASHVHIVLTTQRLCTTGSFLLMIMVMKVLQCFDIIVG